MPRHLCTQKYDDKSDAATNISYNIPPQHKQLTAKIDSKIKVHENQDREGGNLGM